jgi:hypothetical protein
VVCKSDLVSVREAHNPIKLLFPGAINPTFYPAAHRPSILVHPLRQGKRNVDCLTLHISSSHTEEPLTCAPERLARGMAGRNLSRRATELIHPILDRMLMQLSDAVLACEQCVTQPSNQHSLAHWCQFAYMNLPGLCPSYLRFWHFFLVRITPSHPPNHKSRHRQFASARCHHGRLRLFLAARSPIHAPHASRHLPAR